MIEIEQRILKQNKERKQNKEGKQMLVMFRSKIYIFCDMMIVMIILTLQSN